MLPAMIEMQARTGGIVLALLEVEPAETARYGIASVDRPTPSWSAAVAGTPALGEVFRVTGLVEKPDPERSPSNFAVVGRYMLPPEIFDAIRRIKPGAGGEIQLTDAMALLLAEGVPVHGVVYRGTRYDTGLPLGYLQAVVQLARAADDSAGVHYWLKNFVSPPGADSTSGFEAMTAETLLAPTPELTPLADFLAGVLKKTPPVARIGSGPHPGLRQRARRGCAQPNRPAGVRPGLDRRVRRPVTKTCSARPRTAHPARRRGRPERRRAGVRSGSPAAPATRSPPAHRCPPPPTWSFHPPGPTRAWRRSRSRSAPNAGTACAGPATRSRRLGARRRRGVHLAGVGRGVRGDRGRPRGGPAEPAGHDHVHRRRAGRRRPAQPAGPGRGRELARARRRRGRGGRARVPDRDLRRRSRGAARTARGPARRAPTYRHDRRYGHRPQRHGPAGARGGRLGPVHRGDAVRRAARSGTARSAPDRPGATWSRSSACPGTPGRR